MHFPRFLFDLLSHQTRGIEIVEPMRSSLSLALVALLLVTFSFAADTTQPKILPVDQIQPGMKGVAYTVFEGTKPEAMDLEVLGVLKNANGPKSDLILVRLKGKKPEYTGVVAGMSGSPVYIDGKLVGAISYRIGMFSKEPICGITPIEEMLEIDALDRSQPEPVNSGRAATPKMMAKTSIGSDFPASDDLASFASLMQPIEAP